MATIVGLFEHTSEVDRAIDELTTPGFAYHLGGQPPQDRAGMREFVAKTHEAFPDWRVEIADIAIATDVAAVRWRGQVTHGGTFQGIPPTGRRIAVSGINMYRIAEGRISEEWEQTDTIGLLQQLGVRPSHQQH